MCFHVYLGSQIKCPEIPYAERSDDRTQFPQYNDIALHAYELSGEYKLPKLTAPYHYSLGIMSCGCGFAYDVAPTSDAWTLNNHRQLADYVAQCLDNGAHAELFSCWLGDEKMPIEKERRITLEQLRSSEFFFEEHQLTLVYKDVTG